MARSPTSCRCNLSGPRLDGRPPWDPLPTQSIASHGTGASSSARGPCSSSGTSGRSGFGFRWSHRGERRPQDFRAGWDLIVQMRRRLGSLLWRHGPYGRCLASGPTHSPGHEPTPGWSPDGQASLQLSGESGRFACLTCCAAASSEGANGRASACRCGTPTRGKRKHAMADFIATTRPCHDGCRDSVSRHLDIWTRSDSTWHRRDHLPTSPAAARIRGPFAVPPR